MRIRLKRLSGPIDGGWFRLYGGNPDRDPTRWHTVCVSLGRWLLSLERRV